MKTTISAMIALALTSSVAACGGTVSDVPREDQSPALSPPSQERALPRPDVPAKSTVASLVETCDALDDDLDGTVDQGGVCQRACGADAVALATQNLRLPRAGDLTVAPDSGIQPELLAYSTIPAFCTSPTPSTDPDEMNIGCGETVTLPGGSLVKKALRIAPGGVLRLTDETILDVKEILVCPDAVIQAGGAPSRDDDGEPGHNLSIAGDALLVFGKVTTSGGFTVAPQKNGGTGGVLDVHVNRLLLAGILETYSDPPAGARRGEGGMTSLIADEESFISGRMRSGNAYMKIPVCCAGP